MTSGRNALPDDAVECNLTASTSSWQTPSQCVQCM